ncbi:MAG: acyl-CoA dehydrogenase family protein [Casimicrobiaceae bacterium]
MNHTAEPMILESAHRVFSRQTPVELAHGRGGVDTSGLWAAIDDSGLDRILVPEASGGIGADLIDAVGMVRTAGYCAAHAPITEALMARVVLAAAGWPDLAGPVVLGEIEKHADGIGLRVRLPWGRTAKRGCAVEDAGDHVVVHVFGIDAARLSLGENLAGEPRDILALPASGAEQVRTTAMSAGRIRSLCALLLAAQMTGAMGRILEITVEHANTRRQFGKRIAEFQAVQQLVAQLAGETAAATAAVDGGVLLMRVDDSWLGGALAKSRASEAVVTVNGVAHQVVAAMGFTREFPLQLFTRRLWAWRDEFGDEHAWNERIGADVLARGASDLWAYVTDPQGSAS